MGGVESKEVFLEGDWGWREAEEEYLEAGGIKGAGRRREKEEVRGRRGLNVDSKKEAGEEGKGGIYEVNLHFCSL